MSMKKVKQRSRMSSDAVLTSNAVNFLTKQLNNNQSTNDTNMNRNRMHGQRSLAVNVYPVEKIKLLRRPR